MTAVVKGRSVLRTVLWHDLLKTSRRASRYEYWWGGIQVTVVMAAAMLFAVAASEHLPEQYVVPVVIALAVVFALSFVAGFTLQVRRLHDLGMNWWWAATMSALGIASGIYDGYIGELQLDRYLLASWEGGPFHDAMSLTWLDGLGNGVWLMLFAMSGFFIGDDGTNEWGEGPALWEHKRTHTENWLEEHEEKSAMDKPLGVDHSPWSRNNEHDG